MAEETMSKLDTKTLIQATRGSFSIIVPLSNARSGHSAVQGILGQIREEGIKYVVSVSKSVETARSGHQFAMRARDLVAFLAEEKQISDKVFYDSITEMREIAQNAHAAAKDTADRFRANRQGFTRIRESTSETRANIEAEYAEVTARRNNAESQASSWKQKTNSMMGKGAMKTAIYLPAIAVTVSQARISKRKAKGSGKQAVSCETALESLSPAEKNLEQLRLQMDLLTHFWLTAELTLADIETVSKGLQNDHMLLMKTRGLNCNWTEIGRDYQTYHAALIALLDNNPQFAQFIATCRRIAPP